MPAQQGRRGATGMAAMAMAIPLIGAQWPLMTLAIALIRTVLFSVAATTATKPNQQGVALTGRNHTGPPCSVGRPTANMPARRQRYRQRRQRAKQYWPIRRASNNI